MDGFALVRVMGMSMGSVSVGTYSVSLSRPSIRSLGGKAHSKADALLLFLFLLMGSIHNVVFACMSDV
jgi:hypothetical protein